MAVNITKITDANVYLGNKSLLGIVAEIDLPSVNTATVQVDALGTIGTIELPARVEALEVRLKFNSFTKEVLSIAGNPKNFIQLNCFMNAEEYNNTGIQAQGRNVCTIVGFFSTLPLGNLKPGENVEIDTTMKVVYVKYEINGKSVYEFDPVNSVWKVDGVDTLAQRNANLGIK